MNKFEEKIKFYEDYLIEKNVLAQIIVNKDKLIVEKRKALTQYSAQLKNEIKELKTKVKQEELNLQQQKQKLDSKISTMSIEEITKTMVDFINKKQNDLKIEQDNINYLNTAVEIKENALPKEVKNKEQELLIEVEKKQEEIDNKQTQIKKMLLKVQNNFPKITFDEMQDFLINYLDKTTGKQFFSFKDTSSYHGNQMWDYEDYSTNIYFYGVKCTNKVYKDKESILEGTKNGEVILLAITEDGKWGNDTKPDYYNVFDIHSSNIKYISGYSENKMPNMPMPSLIQGDVDGVNVFDSFTGLKDALLNLFKEKFIEEEKRELNSKKSYLERLKKDISSNEKRMQEEIEQTINDMKERHKKELDTVEKTINDIKEKYKKELINNKIQLPNTKLKLEEQEENFKDLTKEKTNNNSENKGEIVIDEYEIN